MQSAHLLTTALIAGAALAAAAAVSAHDQAKGDPGRQIACPVPPPNPAPKPHHHGSCPVHHQRVARADGVRRHGAVAHAYNRDDYGVTASEARIYRQELAQHGLDGHHYAQGAYPDRRGEGRGECCGSPPMGHEDRGFGYERREFSTQGGHVEGMRDGHRFAWSWGAQGRGPDGDPMGPPPGHGPRDGAGPRAGGTAWRHDQGGGYEVYGYAGRDEQGYLVWSSKPRP